MDYPAIFAKERLGLDVDSEPRFTSVLCSQADEMLLLWARQVGKTTAAAAWVTHGAMFLPPMLILIVSATQRQAKILQDRVLRYVRMLNKGTEEWQEIPGRIAEIPESIWNPKLVRCSSLSLELERGTEVISVPASPETVRGYSPGRITFDEAGFASDGVYHAIRPMRARTKAQLMVMSSAGAKRGFFYEAWTKEKHWEKSEIDAASCAWITPDFLATERKVLPLKIYQREYENRFMDLEGAALSPEDIEAMFTNETAIIPFGRNRSGILTAEEAVVLNRNGNGKHG